MLGIGGAGREGRFPACCDALGIGMGLSAAPTGWAARIDDDAGGAARSEVDSGARSEGDVGAGARGGGHGAPIRAGTGGGGGAASEREDCGGAGTFVANGTFGRLSNVGRIGPGWVAMLGRIGGSAAGTVPLTLAAAGFARGTVAPGTTGRTIGGGGGAAAGGEGARGGAGGTGEPGTGPLGRAIVIEGVPSPFLTISGRAVPGTIDDVGFGGSTPGRAAGAGIDVACGAAAGVAASGRSAIDGARIAASGGEALSAGAGGAASPRVSPKSSAPKSASSSAVIESRSASNDTSTSIESSDFARIPKRWFAFWRWRLNVPSSIWRQIRCQYDWYVLYFWVVIVKRKRSAVFRICSRRNASTRRSTSFRGTVGSSRS